jgi:hypothetical protein
MTIPDSTLDGQDPGTGNPKGSGNEEDKPNSEVDLKATVSDVLSELLPDLVEKQFQSQKDRRLGKLETATGKTEDRLTRIEQLVNEGGLDFNQAKAQADAEVRNAALDKLLAEQVSASQANANVSNVNGVLQSIFGAHGIDPNDARVTQFLSENTGEDVVAKASVFAAELKATKIASPITQQTIASGSPQHTNLMQQYQNERAKVLEDIH